MIFQLTGWVFLVWIQIFENIHCEIHHVCVAKQLKFPKQHVILIVKLQTQNRLHIIYIITVTDSGIRVRGTKTGGGSGSTVY